MWGTKVRHSRWMKNSGSWRQGRLDARAGDQPTGRAHGQGRAGPWGAGDQPCCGVTGAGTDSPWGAEMGSWAVDRVEAAPRGWAGTGRASGALGALTI